MNLININDINDPELDVFSRMSEVQLYHLYEPKLGVFIAESANVILRALEAGYEPLSLLMEEERMETEGTPVFNAIRKLYGDSFLDHIPIYIAPREIVTLLTGYKLVRGLWAVLRRKEVQDMISFLNDKKRITVLYDVVNPTNVGAIIRSAAALGVEGAILTHASVDPLTRRSTRVSMGTVFQLPWTKIGRSGPNGVGLLGRINELGFKTAAMALTDDSISVDDLSLRSCPKLAVILGTEGTGLPEEVIRAADYRVKIPMYHGVDSLNVAAASAVCFWEMMKPL